jgi:mercuric reductase
MKTEETLMNEKVDKALERLTSILPLKEKQESCSPDIKNLHRRMLRSFVENGRILTKEEMARHVDDPEKAADVLKNNDMVVFSCAGDPIGAYPFTMEQREHKVRVNGHEVHAMCALDALSISSMFGIRTRIASRCRVTGDPVTIEQTGQTLENRAEAGDVCFGIIWEAAGACSCCADSLCMEMMFLKDGQVADQWLAEDPDNREIFTLDEAIDFGKRFFMPLMS